MTDLEYTAEQIIQEMEYEFPYHYIPRYDHNFSEILTDRWGINYAATIEFLLRQLEEISFSSVIDIGCGDGRFTRELSKSFPDKEVVGLDYSERAICLARAMNPDHKFIHENILYPTKNMDKFDIGILMEVLEHIPKSDLKQFLSAVSDLLGDQGLLVITVPHENQPVELKHFQHFSVESISAAIDEFFTPVRIIPFESKSIKKNILDKILVNNIFALNNNVLLNSIYKYYKKRLFLVEDEKQCKRLFIIAKKRN